jgi:hypothetical protein
MAHWHVYLFGIEWDDSKGEYDVSDLPQSVSLEVEADTRHDAIEEALTEVSDQFGMLIQQTEQIDAQRR